MTNQPFIELTEFLEKYGYVLKDGTYHDTRMGSKLKRPDIEWFRFYEGRLIDEKEKGMNAEKVALRSFNEKVESILAKYGSRSIKQSAGQG